MTLNSTIIKACARVIPVITERYPEIQQLADEDKLQLASELWSDVVGDSTPDDPSLEQTIAERLAEYHAHPERVSSWADVKARLLGSRP
ncbi:hypothetical protein AYO49_00085 [Verrucomicrobiaceae bacterium SCGC AG-212-N21]|nr:hypothetical protein AYO49_00085 [Verrucomicrobiaceae bacterium SCGC AG-212-N21]